MTLLLQAPFDQLVEIVDSHFAQDKPDNLCRISFLKFRDELLQAVPSMEMPLGTDQLAYAAVGFLGKVQFTKGARSKAFGEKPTREAFAELRTSGEVTMVDSAIPIWKYLEGGDANSALSVMALCALAGENAVIKKALKPAKK